MLCVHIFGILFKNCFDSVDNLLFPLSSQIHDVVKLKIKSNIHTHSFNNNNAVSNLFSQNNPFVALVFHEIVAVADLFIEPVSIFTSEVQSQFHSTISRERESEWQK